MLKSKIISLAAVSTILSMGPMGNAIAADGAALFKSKICWSCHGKDANTPIMPVYPKLAGQNADYAFSQMKDIKAGTRANGQSVAMKGVMGLVNEEEMRAIADWLATLK